jgi:DNA-3-methyladenine glycosylase II
MHIDDRLASIVEAAGLVNPYVWPGVPLHEGDLLSGLVFHIVSQQISMSAAIVVFERLRRQLGGRISPEALAASAIEELRTAGLSTAKARSLNELGAKIATSAFSLHYLQELSDDRAQAELVTLRGVGPWTAAVFSLLEMKRPDVFPAGDLGLRIAVGRLDELAAPPAAKNTAARAIIWSPFRSYAAMYLWEWRAAVDRARTPAHKTS